MRNKLIWILVAATAISGAASKTVFAANEAAPNEISLTKEQINDIFQSANQEIEKGTKDDKAYGARGEVYKHIGKFAKSVEDLTQAISLNDQQPEWYRERAESNLLLQKKEEALADIRQAVKLEPKNPYNYKILTIVLGDMGEHQQAVTAITTAIRLVPCVNYYLLRAALYGALSKYREAIKDTNAALRIDPQSGDAKNDRQGYMIKLNMANP